MPTHQGPPLGVAGRVRRRGKPIRSVPAQLQELPEGVAMLGQPPTGLRSDYLTHSWDLVGRGQGVSTHRWACTPYLWGPNSSEIPNCSAWGRKVPS